MTELREPRDPALEAELRALPDVEPPAGWQQRVLAAVEAGEAPAGRGRRPWVAIGALVAAAAAVVIFLAVRPREPRGDGAIAFAVDVRAGSAVVRAGSATTTAARLGDAIVASARWSGEGELRIYRDDRTVVARCTAGSCSRRGEQLVLEHVVTAVGAYRAVLLVGAAAPPTGTLDGDIAGHRGEHRVRPLVQAN